MATHHKGHAQRGGTIIGFILGVLVGLAGALAVAVYVTKVPVPFVDRAISRKPSEDAAEAERNKNWNPNAALTGKPAKTATPEPAASAPADADSSAAAAKKAKTEEAVAKDKTDKSEKADKADKTAAKPSPDPAESAVPGAASNGKTYSSDPLGDLAQAKGQGKTVSTAAAKPAGPEGAAADPFTYFVQVGAFRTPEDAQAQRAKLALMGLDAKVTEREQSGRTVYRVRLGPYERQTDAERMKDNLQTGGLDSALVRVQR